MRLRWRPKMLCVALRQKATCSFLTQRRTKRKAKMNGSHGNQSKFEQESRVYKCICAKSTLED